MMKMVVVVVAPVPVEPAGSAVAWCAWVWSRSGDHLEDQVGWPLGAGSEGLHETPVAGVWSASTIRPRVAVAVAGCAGRPGRATPEGGDR
jgi:hypothetical protein